MKFSEIIEQLDDSNISHSLKLNKQINPEITVVQGIDDAQVGSISYIEGDKFSAFVGKTNASALILPLDEQLQKQAQERDIAWIATAKPRQLFAQIIAIFYQPWRPEPEVHSSAVIHPTAKIGNDVYIGANVVIQPGAEIGDGVCIHPNVVIYPQAKIGNRTVLHANSTIHERSSIGADCVIHCGAVIGAEGFGFVPTPDGWLKMEQSGYTILENGVEVGCNSTIDRPSVGETRIGYNTKIDNLVQVGHGCQIGANCVVAAQSGMAGGVKIGNRVILAGQSGINNQVTIGDGATTSAKAGVHNNIAPGEVVCGSPAMPYRTYLKVSAILNRLPEIYQSVKRLQRNSRTVKK